MALSVSLTAVSTVISPILTPLITLLLIGNQIPFDPIDMFISIIEIVIIPIILGLILNYKFPDFCEKLKDYLPAISSIVICLIVAGVIGANKQAILTSSGIIIVVIILQYFTAMSLGFGIGYLAGMGKTNYYGSHRIGISKFRFVNQCQQRLIFQTYHKPRFPERFIQFGKISQDHFAYIFSRYQQ